MAMSETVEASGSNYRAVFERYTANSVQRLLERARLAEPILSLEDRTQTFHTLHYAFKLPTAWPVTRELLLTVAPHMEQAGHRDEWMFYLEQAIALSQQMGDSQAAAELQLQLGLLYQLRSNYETARRYLEVSAKQFEALDDPLNQARALNQLAQVARYQRRFNEATRLVEIALRLLDEEAVERAFSFFVLGVIAFDKRNWQEAERYFEQALALWTRVNDKRMMGRSLMSLSTVLLPQNKYQAAIEVNQQAIILFEVVQDPTHRAISQMNLGNVYLSLDQPQQALELYQPAEHVFRQTQDLFYLAHVNHNIGMAYRHLEEWAMAETAYRRSIDYQEKVGNLAWLVDTMDGLGLGYLNQGQPEQAITVFEAALERLTEIQGEPRHDHLLTMVSAHLQDANHRLNPKIVD
ncbi:MAG: tetratricopeptide repeat protein [Anaerolineales bacterium]|nr:tetratricopeptide repeat protein [Anaerolineales bacterium]